MAVEFTVHGVRVLPSGHYEAHLLIDDELSTLIQQLCEDGFAEDVLRSVSEWESKPERAENGG